MDSVIVGIDLSKKKFDVCGMQGVKTFHRVFKNAKEGFSAFLYCLQKKGIATATIAMEATGSYGEELATFLHENGFTVFMINPAQIKFFSKSQLLRAKTDKVDARVIAEFAQQNRGHRPWTPPTPSQKRLQTLFRCLEDLKQDRTCIINRLKSARTPEIEAIWQTSLDNSQRQIEEIERQLREHVDQDPDLKEKRAFLESFPGIGEVACWGILSEIPDIKKFKDARCLVAFAGLNPSIFESGTSVRRKGKISKMGSPTLRRLLYMPTLSAIRYNPDIRAFYQRLRAKGKKGKVAVIACMRKILHIIFALLNKKTTFSYSI